MTSDIKNPSLSFVGLCYHHRAACPWVFPISWSPYKQGNHTGATFLTLRDANMQKVSDYPKVNAKIAGNSANWKGSTNGKHCKKVPTLIRPLENGPLSFLLAWGWFPGQDTEHGKQSVPWVLAHHACLAWCPCAQHKRNSDMQCL